MDETKIADTLSTFMNPPIITIPLFLVISIVLSFTDSGFDFYKFIVLEVISLVFASLLPMAIILHWAKKPGNDKDISDRSKRFVPLIVGTVSYFIGFIVSLIFNVDIFMALLLLCYTVNTFIVMLITTRWKISIHTTGLSGPVGALILLLGPIGAAIAVLYPILIWSRVTLKKHTMAQAICGGVFGFFMTIAEMYLYLNILNIHITNIIPLIDAAYYVLAIITAPIILGILSYVHIKNSRIVFYVLSIITLGLFIMYAPIDAQIILVLIDVVTILVSYLSNENFAWHRALF